MANSVGMQMTQWSKNAENDLFGSVFGHTNLVMVLV
eukprot:CAMPEP_0178743716 /NCGR_PEP_ID=MMETSP0744-20121128/6355_1 /TAXON_ID=913974 /ORGANISM="Nitzschia punctata, Strain CCMP561" /LENGTH=35 /DNA_ID= /DNA_START= /DNA_END= /DNA_ORIENTATION=